MFFVVDGGYFVADEVGHDDVVVLGVLLAADADVFEHRVEDLAPVLPALVPVADDPF